MVSRIEVDARRAVGPFEAAKTTTTTTMHGWTAAPKPHKATKTRDSMIGTKIATDSKYRSWGREGLVG